MYNLLYLYTIVRSYFSRPIIILTNNKNMKYTFQLILVFLLTIALSGCFLLGPKKSGQTEGTQYSITIKNTLPGERLAPVLAVADADDTKIWVGKYVSEEARIQFTTGNPSKLAEALGGDLSINGKIPVDGSLTFKFKTKASTIRITAMVHPDKTPDNYVTALIPLSGDNTNKTIDLVRFDIGDDEDRKTVVKVGKAGTVTQFLF